MHARHCADKSSIDHQRLATSSSIDRCTVMMHGPTSHVVVVTVVYMHVRTRDTSTPHMPMHAAGYDLDRGCLIKYSFYSVIIEGYDLKLKA